MSKGKTNENFIHRCTSKQVKIAAYRRSIVESGMAQEDICEILDFFLFHAPMLKNDKKTEYSALKRLKDFGWTGNAKLLELEGKLLEAAEMEIFCILKSDTIKQTLKEMNLENQICICHPRAVMKQNCRITVCEDETVKIGVKESRMECLFRHIRNAFAHNDTYFFENGFVLLEDYDMDRTVSAKILFERKTLLQWIQIVKNEEAK